MRRNYFTSSGDGQRVPLGGTIAAPLSVTVFDFFDNRVPNAQVQFAAPPTGPSGSFGDQLMVTVLTNSLGVAVAPPFTANLRPGAYQVTGTVAGTSLSPTFDLTNVAADHFETGPWDEWRNRRGLVHRVGDFNNDGLDDIASFHRVSDRWKVGLAQPGGGFVTSEWADFAGKVSWTGHLVADFNGDGFDDVAQFRRDSGRVARLPVRRRQRPARLREPAPGPTSTGTAGPGTTSAISTATARPTSPASAPTTAPGT